MEKPEKIILASASPRRHELLAKLLPEFEIITADVEEFADPLADPTALVHHNAKLKAEAVSEKHSDALVIGSDTTVFHNQLILGKPVDMDDARKMIKKLSGDKHTVYTGVSILCGSQKVDELFVDQSTVFFKQLSDEDIEKYFSIVNPLDKAGSYGIQEGKEIIIESFEGSLSNIMGLPMEMLAEKLTELEII